MTTAGAPLLKRRRNLGVTSGMLLLVGSICTLVSFASLSWYTVSGPNVITSIGQGSGSSTEPELLVSRDQGTHHSVAMWAIVVVCILAATAVQIRRVRLTSVWMAVTVVLTAIGLLDVIGRVSIAKMTVGANGLPSGTSIDWQFGVWIAIAGLVLIALSAVVTGSSRSDVSAP